MKPPPQTSPLFWGIFGCHHLNNTAPTPPTPQTWPHAGVLVVPFAGLLLFHFLWPGLSGEQP